MNKVEEHMATTAQTLANRNNAQLSTGPKTTQGIENSKLNATKHGLCGKQIVIQGEDATAYDELRASLIDAYKPVNELEAMLVENIAQSYWRLQRAERIEMQLTTELGELAIFTDDAASKKYALFLRHRTAIERSWRRSMKELEKLIVIRETNAAARQSFPVLLPRPIGSVPQKTDSVEEPWPARNPNPSTRPQASASSPANA
jgi:hypothetical protein